MRFLVDECTGPTVASWLRSQSFDVFSIYDEARGMTDDDILAKACTENWILVTNDKDFGEMVYRERKPHRGIVFLRLQDESAVAKTDAIRKLLASHGDRLPDAFVVVTETQVRFAASGD